MSRYNLIQYIHQRKHYSIAWLESKCTEVLLAIYSKVSKEA